MTQDEKWIAKYNEIMAFMAENHRRPSKYKTEDRNAWNWLRHTQKQYNAGALKLERVEAFKELMENSVRKTITSTNTNDIQVIYVFDL